MEEHRVDKNSICAIRGDSVITTAPPIGPFTFVAGTDNPSLVGVAV